MARDNDILLQTNSVTEKRGRGRPPKPGAMTNAQRVAAFRARQKAAGKPVTVSKREHDELLLECERLREELAQARRAAAKPHGRMPGKDAPAVPAVVLTGALPADKAESPDRRLAVTINGRELFSLGRLEAHYGLPRRAVLERLIWWADRSAVESLGDAAAFDRYLSGVTRNR